MNDVFGEFFGCQSGQGRVEIQLVGQPIYQFRVKDVSTKGAGILIKNDYCFAEIPDGTKKICSGCFTKMNRKIGQVLSDPESVRAAAAAAAAAVLSGSRFVA